MVEKICNIVIKQIKDSEDIEIEIDAVNFSGAKICKVLKKIGIRPVIMLESPIISAMKFILSEKEL